MTLIRTGPGKVFIKQMGAREVGVPHAILARDMGDEHLQSDAVVYALLYNFDNDGDELKREHRNDLRRFIIEPILLREHDLVVHMYGHASRRFNANYNGLLSERRIAKTRAYLRQQGVSEARLREFEIQGFGEERSGGGTIDEESHRSVALIIARPNVPVTNIRLPRPELRDDRERIVLRRQAGGGSHEFAIRVDLMGRLNAVPLTELAAIEFTLWDTENMLVAFYKYRGAGLTVPIVPIIPLPGSLTFTGPWNCFHMPGPIRVGDFGGAALFERGSLGLDAGLRFKMLGFAVARANRNEPLVFDPLVTGEGIGGLSLASGQANSGVLAFDDVKGIRPFREISRVLGPSGLAESCDARAGLMRRVGGRVVQ